MSEVPSTIEYSLNWKVADCFSYLRTNILKKIMNRRMEKKKEKIRNRDEGKTNSTFTLETGPCDFKSPESYRLATEYYGRYSHESRIFKYCKKTGRGYGHSWTVLWHVSSVCYCCLNLMEHNTKNLTDVSLNELKHVKHRTSNDIHCGKRYATLVLSTPTKTRVIRKACRCFAYNFKPYQE